MAADPAYDCPAFDAGLGRFNSARPDGARMGRLPGTSKVGVSTPKPAGTGDLYFEIDAINYTDLSQKVPADNQQATRVDLLVCTFYAGVKATFIDPDKYARAKLVEATSRATEAPPPPPHHHHHVDVAPASVLRLGPCLAVCRLPRKSRSSSAAC